MTYKRTAGILLRAAAACTSLFVVALSVAVGLLVAPWAGFATLAGFALAAALWFLALLGGTSGKAPDGP